VASSANRKDNVFAPSDRMFMNNFDDASKQLERLDVRYTFRAC